MDIKNILPEILPGVLAGIMSSCYAFLNSISTIFGGPEIPKYMVIKALAEILIAFPITMIAGYAFAKPLSQVLTSVCQIFAKGLEFNPVAAGVLIGFVGVHGTKKVVDKLVSNLLDRSKL